MLYLALLFLAAWAVLLAFKVTVGAIHLLLIAALVCFAVGFFKGGRFGGRRTTGSV